MRRTGGPTDVVAGATGAGVRRWRLDDAPPGPPAARVPGSSAEGADVLCAHVKADMCVWMWSHLALRPFLGQHGCLGSPYSLGYPPSSPLTFLPRTVGGPCVHDEHSLRHCIGWDRAASSVVPTERDGYFTPIQPPLGGAWARSRTTYGRR